MRVRLRMRILAVAAAAATAAGLAMPAVSNAATSDPREEAGPNCRFHDVKVPASVVLDALDPAKTPEVEKARAEARATNAQYTIHGRLCMPEGKTPKTVMLAVHGILYNNGYWNVSYQPEKYNYAQYMNDAGYGVFSIDRLGIGKSSKPLAALVTLDSQAEVAHQIITRLRAGTIADTAFERVMLVGYSYGSATSLRETSRYNDADAVIVTAWGSTMQTGTLARILPTFQPAQLEKQFRDRPVGYFSSPVGRDQNYFYDLSNVDPAMMDYSNEYLADTISTGELLTFYPRFGGVPVTNAPFSSDEVTLPLSKQTKRITVPTFLVNGTGELWFCGIDQQHCTSSQELQREEAAYYSDDACFRAAVIPKAGHNLNLQYNAQYSYAQMRTYADQVLGPDGANKDSYRDRCKAFSGENVQPGPGRFGALGG